MQVLLVRHALPVRVEGADGPADPHLDELGHRQAAALAEWLVREGIDRVYTSPLVRAVETAAPLARALGVDAVVADGVAEFDRHADEYVPLEELRATNDPRWQQLLEGGYFDEGELTADQFQHTVVEAIEGIVAENPSRTVAVVCHGGVINAWFSHLLGIDQLMFFEPAYTSVSRFLASGRGHRTLASLNETAHLRSLRA